MEEALHWILWFAVCSTGFTALIFLAVVWLHWQRHRPAEIKQDAD